MAGDGAALLGMPGIELLGIIRVMCETIDNKTTSRKFDFKSRHVTDSQNCKTNRNPQARLYTYSMSKYKTKMPDYPNSTQAELICQII